jgi:undecaprenyl diphosphate synthase
LILALSYSGRWEILKAIKQIAADVKSGKLEPDAINEQSFENYLQTSGIPDPELLIRTSGELRISNFLLWQIAYTELFITPTLWPDFRKEHLYEAVWAYQQRERRFGKTSEQLNPVTR